MPSQQATGTLASYMAVTGWRQTVNIYRITSSLKNAHDRLKTVHGLYGRITEFLVVLAGKLGEFYIAVASM